MLNLQLSYDDAVEVHWILNEEKERIERLIEEKQLKGLDTEQLNKDWNAVKKVLTELEFQAERLSWRLVFFKLDFDEVSA